MLQGRGYRPIVIIDFPPIEHHTHYKKPGVLLHISRCVTGWSVTTALIGTPQPLRIHDLTTFYSMGGGGGEWQNGMAEWNVEWNSRNPHFYGSVFKETSYLLFLFV